MAFLIEFDVVAARFDAIWFGRNNGGFTGFAEDLDHPFVSVKCFVCDQDIGLDSGKQNIRAIQIMGLARRDVKSRRIAQSINRGVDFCT